MALLTPNTQATIKIQENLFQLIDPLFNEIVVDGRSLLNEALKLMCPDVQTNVNAELAKIKAVKPVNHAYNIVKWRLAMESKRNAIEQRVPGSYHESQYIMDYLDASLTVDAKSVKAEVNIICNRYLCGNPDRWNALYMLGNIDICAICILRSAICILLNFLCNMVLESISFLFRRKISIFHKSNFVES
jgi:hypothetical protein